MNKEKSIDIINSELYEILASKELSFGCKVFIQNYCVSVVIVGDNRGLCVTEGTEYDEFLATTGTHTQPFGEKQITKIIGHEPTRDDVLLKLYARLDKDSATVETICAGNGGMIVSSKFGNNKSNFLFLYNLLKSFDNQSEETKRKLHALICKPNKS